METAGLECSSCGAALVVPATMKTTVCPYCAAPSVVDRPPARDRPSPSFVIGFVQSREAALAATRAWIKTKAGVFTHSGLRRARLDDVRGVYVPAYLYTGVARSEYAASIGEDYTTTETYTTTDAKGNTTTHTRTVTHTEHRPLQGVHAAYVRDVVVTASRGVQNDELERIEPFDLRALARFTPAALSGWAAEEPTLTLAECADLARREAMQHVGQMLVAFMPGDSHSGLQHRTSFDHEVLDLALVPLWVLAVRYDPQKPPMRLLINGQTGRVHGHAPVSRIKVTLAIVFAVLVVAGAIAALVIAGGRR